MRATSAGAMSRVALRSCSEHLSLPATTPLLFPRNLLHTPHNTHTLLILDIDELMSGIAYSALANWDGSLSVSGSQAGGGNTTREPTAAPSSVAGSPGPRPHPISSALRSPVGNVTASPSGVVSRSTLVSAPHASGSGTSAAAHSDAYALNMNDRSTAAPSSSYRAMDRGRRSEESSVQEASKVSPRERVEGGSVDVGV